MKIAPKQAAGQVIPTMVPSYIIPHKKSHGKNQNRLIHIVEHLHGEEIATPQSDL